MYQFTKNGMTVNCYGEASSTAQYYCVFEDSELDSVWPTSSSSWEKIVNEVTIFAETMGTKVLEIQVGCVK